jgi:hypothetical protein
LLIRLVDEQDLEVALASQSLIQTIGPTVAIMGNDEQVTRLEELHHDVQCCHARRGHYSSRAAFEHG